MGPYGDSYGGGGATRRGLKLWPIVLFLIYLAYYWFSHQETTAYTGRRQLIDTSPQQEAALGLQSYQEILSQEHVVTSGPVVNEVRDVAKRLVVFRPIIEDRSAIEADAVRHLAGFHGETLGNAAPLEKAEQVEGRFQRHILENLVIGEVFDLDGQIGRQLAKLVRQVAVGLHCQRLEGADRRRMAVPPIIAPVYMGHEYSFLCGPYRTFSDDFRVRNQRQE